MERERMVRGVGRDEASASLCTHLVLSRVEDLLGTHRTHSLLVRTTCTTTPQSRQPLAQPPLAPSQTPPHSPAVRTDPDKTSPPPSAPSACTSRTCQTCSPRSPQCCPSPPRPGRPGARRTCCSTRPRGRARTARTGLWTRGACSRRPCGRCGPRLRSCRLSARRRSWRGWRFWRALRGAGAGRR